MPHPLRLVQRVGFFLLMSATYSIAYHRLTQRFRCSYPSSVRGPIVAVVMLPSYRELMFQKANEYTVFVLDAPLRFQQATHVIIRGRKPGDSGCVCCRGHIRKGRPRHFTDLYGRTKVPRGFFSLDRVNAIINPTVCKTLCLRRFVKVDGAHIELNSEVCA